MEIKEIRELIKFVSQSGVAEVEIAQGDFKISIKTTNGQIMVSAPQYVAQQPMPSQQFAPPSAQAPQAPQQSDAPAAPDAGGNNANLITIKSPMIGTFYRSSSPDKPMFVNIGDEIKAGKPICIIEAMKLFNEIESEVSGRVVKILVDNASPVEYDQPLFLVEPI